MPFQENHIINHQNDGKRFLNSLTYALKRLPTHPQIQLKLLNLCNIGSSRIHDIISIIRTDPALCFKVLNTVHLSGSRIPRKVDIIGQAVQTIGIDCITNIIATSSADMILDNFSNESVSFYLNEFWQHSLKCALISETIAEETNYKYPDEAFIAGLLHDIGKLVLIVKFPGIHRKLFGAHQDTINELISSEEINIGIDHTGIAASLIDQWNFDPILTDAISYHHYPFEKVNYASDLVKIIFTANILASGGKIDQSQSRRRSIQLAGISEEQAKKYVDISEESVSRTINFLGIMDKGNDESEANSSPYVWKELFKEVRNFSLTGGMFNNLLEAENRTNIVSFCRKGLGALTGLWNIYVFIYDHEQKALVPDCKSDNPSFNIPEDLSVPMELKGSLLVSSLLKNIPLNSFTYGEQSKLTLIDKQIIHFARCEGIICIPMITRDRLIGTIVIGLNRIDLSPFQDLMSWIRMFIRNISSVLYVEQEREKPGKQDEISYLESTTGKTKKVIHEINNPLSVIKNYLKVLGLKLSEHDVAQDELRIINEEINRIGNLLKTLTVSDEKILQQKESVNVNSLITDIVKLAKGTLSNQSGIKIYLDLDSSIPDIYSIKDNFKQVFINLLNNAIEAMTEGGNILIRTEYLNDALKDSQGVKTPANKGKIKISIMDDGPGISTDIKEKMFHPSITSKNGHEGLGLSVVKKLIDNMNGSIWIENGTGNGACFNIQLPAPEAGHQ